MQRGRTSARATLARKREAEVLERLQKGETFEQIAEAVGFKDASGAWRAATRALARIPVAAAEQLRQVDSMRIEKMYLALQPGLARGDVRSVQVAIKLLARRARLHGYDFPARLEVSGRSGESLVSDQLDYELMASRLSEQDQLTLLALMNKARGGPGRTESPTNGNGNGSGDLG